MVNNISSYQLGKLVQIDFSSRVKYQLSKTTKDFDNFIMNYSIGDKGGERSFEFPLQTSGGPNAVQSMSADGSIDEFPTGQLSDVNFYEGVYKEIAATIEVSLNAWQKAMDAPDKYAEPLMLESKSKSLVAKKEQCINLYGDGTGRRLVIGSASYASNAVTLTGDNLFGHAGWLQHGELIYIMANTATIASGTPSATIAAGTSSGTASYYKVTGRNLRNNTVTLGKAYDSSGTELTITGIGSIVATNVVYKKGQKTAVATNSTITADYNTITEVGAGYESILANDGRKVHGITMSDAVAGGHYTASGAFDPQHIQEGLTDIKAAVGDEYMYNQLVMAPKMVDVFVEGLNTDQYFRGDDPKKRGGKAFFYQHGNDALELVGSEYCPNYVIYSNPQAMDKEETPLEFRGKDFELVDVGGGDGEYLVPGTNAYKRGIHKYLTGRYCFVSKHPAASLVIKGYDQP